jgi:hypothetical protein
MHLFDQVNTVGENEHVSHERIGRLQQPAGENDGDNFRFLADHGYRLKIGKHLPEQCLNPATVTHLNGHTSHGARRLMSLLLSRYEYPEFAAEYIKKRLRGLFGGVREVGGKIGQEGGDLGCPPCFVLTPRTIAD